MASQPAVIAGASSGVGFHLAKVFAENGFDLIIASNGERLEDAETCLKAHGVRVTAVHADLASYEGVDHFWQTVEAAGRPVDAIAINADVGVRRLVRGDQPAGEINLVRLNVEGTMHIAKHAAKHMVAKGSGKILFTASIAAEMVAPREAVYSASKAFDLSLAKSLRAELEGTGVTVTALQPGPTTQTSFIAPAWTTPKSVRRGRKKVSLMKSPGRASKR